MRPGAVELSDDQLIPPDAMRAFVVQVFSRAGVSDLQAQRATDVLMWASLRGVDTHGVRNLKSQYIDPIRSGKVNLQAQLIVEHETATTARADGDRGLGIAVSHDAMRLAIDKAKASGVGLVNVRNSHHLGAAGYFSELALAHDQIGICLTGEFFAGRHDIGMAPINSHRPLFSSNPISVAVPCGRHAPYVLDMSTSVTSINRVQRYGQMGQAIPLGWALDADGRPTTDPAAARLIVPLGGPTELGGHKGVGLAMLVSILSAVLSGGWAPIQADSEDTAPEYRQSSKAHFFGAIRVDHFLPQSDFQTAMDAMVDAVHNVPRENPNERVYYPGEREHLISAKRRRSGIPLIPAELEELRALAHLFNLEMPR